MVDAILLARKIAAVRDAVARVRGVLPADREAFLADRTAREVVVFNLFLALQEAIGLATHWLADAGVQVPDSYGETFVELGRRGVIDVDLASWLKAAAGLRNLVANQYGVLDFGRVYDMASRDLGDLLTFVDALAARAGQSPT